MALQLGKHAGIELAYNFEGLALPVTTCGEKWAEHILLFGFTVKFGRFTNLIRASLVSASFGNEKKTNSPEADVFLQSITLQYLILELYNTTE